MRLQQYFPMERIQKESKNERSRQGERIKCLYHQGKKNRTGKVHWKEGGSGQEPKQKVSLVRRRRKGLSIGNRQARSASGQVDASIKKYGGKQVENGGRGGNKIGGEEVRSRKT